MSCVGAFWCCCEVVRLFCGVNAKHAHVLYNCVAHTGEANVLFQMLRWLVCMQVVFLVVLSGAVLVDKLSASMLLLGDNELRVPVELALSACS